MTQNKTFVHKITKDLCLYCIEIDNKPAVVTKRELVHHVIIFDRSGSMTWLLDELCDDLIEIVKKIDPEDTLTLGWFSSEGKYNWIFKGLATGNNQQAIVDSINKHRNSVALTCFSDILSDTAEHVIDDLSVIKGSFSLTFLTDGYPVVSNYEREITKVMDSLSKISAKISSVLFIGYGDYYNKELMSKMATRCGGVLVHASRLEEFEDHVSKHVTGMIASKRIEVRIPCVIQHFYSAFSVDLDTITSIPVENFVAYVPEGISRIWLLSDVMNEFPDPGFSMQSELLAAAYLEVAATRTENAMAILGRIGDINLIDLTANSWTNAEYGRTERAISNAVFNEEHRFVSGRNTNYVPSPDAFCLVDALNLLMDDPHAYFYPRHPMFVYKRTGVRTFTKDGYPKFEAKDNTACGFNKLVWNSSRLNLGLLTQIPGYVDIGTDAWDHALSENFATYVWRNYTLVKDGILNTTVIPASMSIDRFIELQRHGMIKTNYAWKEDEIFPVHLDAVPIVNSNIAKPVLATEYCKWLNAELHLEYQQKYLKWLLAKNDPDGIEALKGIEYTNDQIEYLKTKGINAKGEYAPPVDKGESVDYYMAKKFEVKIKGFSSIPKIEDVLTKMSSDAKLTPSESVMATVIDGFYNLNITREIKEELNNTKCLLSDIRKMIQSTRFAVLLCKKWFPDLATRDGAVVVDGDMQYTFSITETKVEY